MPSRSNTLKPKVSPSSGVSLCEVRENGDGSAVSMTGRETKLFVQAPCGALAAIVKRFLVVEFPAGHEDSHLPDTGFVAAFVLRGRCVLNGDALVPATAITGLWNSVRNHNHSSGNTVVLVQFTTTGAAGLLRQPLDEFANATVALPDVFARGAEVDDLHEKVSAAPNHAHRVRLLEQNLLQRVAGFRPDPLVSAAVDGSNTRQRPDGSTPWPGMSV